MFHKYTENFLVDNIEKLSFYENSSFISKEYDKVINERISFYKNVSLLPYNYYVPFFKNKIIEDCNGLHGDRVSLKEKKDVKNKIYINEPCFYIDDPWCATFQHWIGEFIPKIDVFLNLKQKIKSLKLIINNTLPSSVNIMKNQDLIKIIEYKHHVNDIIFMSQNYDTDYFCENFYIMNPTGIDISVNNNLEFYLEDYHRKSHQILIDVFYDKNYKFETYEKIYISRSENYKSSRGTRKVINSYELGKFFDHFKFKQIFSENLDFYDRINIFNRVDYLCGEHGGGLNNLKFMKKQSNCSIIGYPVTSGNFWVEYGKKFGINVIEIENVASIIEDKYICKYPSFENYNVNIHPRIKPWIIDLYKLEEILKNLNFI